MSVQRLPLPAPFPDQGNGAYRILRLFQPDVLRAVDGLVADPQGTQRARLVAMLQRAPGSAFGAAWPELAGATPPAGAAPRAGDDPFALLRTLPIRTHADLLPWLDRVEAGETDVLTRGPVLQLVETSGTTGRPKHLPVTAAWSASCALAQRAWMLGLLRVDEALAGGRALSVVSPAEHARSAGGLAIGSNTGRIFLAQPWWTRWRAAVPYAVCGIPDPEVRAYTLLRHALGQDVRSWTTANPSTILLYARRLVEWWPELRQDALDGTLRRGPAARLARGDRVRLAVGLRRVPARRLPDVDPRPAAVWPLRQVNCWTGGSARFFLDRLPDALGAPLPVREVGIHASEGVFAVPVDAGDPVAWLPGHVLELRELDSGRVRWAWEAEPGREYELVVTTEAGLWRYAMGDVVRCTGWLGGAPRLVFVRKAGAFLNATGEKVTEDQVLAAAGRVLHGAVGICAATEWSDPPRVVLGVEPGSQAPDPAQLARAMDRELALENLEYASKRESARLGPASVTLLAPGTFRRWRDERIAAGAPEAQVKDPVIVSLDRLLPPRP